MVSKQTEIARLELGADWLDSNDAARAIGTTTKTLSESIRPLITHQSRSLAGKGARCVGYAYARVDIERVAAIKDALAVDALQAARLFQGIRRLGELGMLRKIETQLALSIGRTKRTVRNRP